MSVTSIFKNKLYFPTLTTQNLLPALYDSNASYITVSVVNLLDLWAVFFHIYLPTLLIFFYQ